MKQCNHCEEWKDEEEFNWRYQGLGVRSKTCRSCKAGQDAAWYVRHKDVHRENVRQKLAEKRNIARDYVWNYLSTHPCVDDGEPDPIVLTFDHVRGKKKMAVSEMVQRGYSIEAIQEEIDKCEVVCFNCHMRREKKRRGGKLGIELELP